MATLALLHQAVQTTLANQRLGRPVFVRYLVQSLQAPDALVPRLAQITAVVRDWLRQPLERLYAVGTKAFGQVALSLQFQEGATALVIFACSQPREPGVDLLVLGNRGSLSYDAGSAELWSENLTATEPSADPVIQAAIEQSLQSGRPVSVTSEGRP
jgi:hypothetical protein